MMVGVSGPPILARFLDAGRLSRVTALGEPGYLSCNRVCTKVVLQKLGRASAIGVVHNVVPVEDAAGFVTTEFHSDTFRDAGAHHVPDGGPAQIVDDYTRETGLLAGCFPSLPEVADRLAVVVKHVCAIRPALFVRPLYNFEKLTP